MSSTKKRWEYLRAVSAEPWVAHNWRDEVKRERSEFYDLAERVGMPWVDRRYFEEKLVSECSMPELPRLKRVNAVLAQQYEMSEALLEVVFERDQLLHSLKYTSCVFNPGVPCHVDAHQACCVLLKSLDRVSQRILELVVEWRRNLCRDLPFMVKGNNLLLQIAEECGQSGVIGRVEHHLKSTCVEREWYYSSTFAQVAQQLHEEELEKQIDVCHEARQLARVGMYMPVLKIRATPDLKAIHTIQIHDHATRQKLLQCYSAGLRMLYDQRDTKDNRSLVDLAAISRDLSMLTQHATQTQLFRVWVSFVALRRQYKKSVEFIERQTTAQHAGDRFRQWQTIALKRLALLRRADNLTQQANAMIYFRYMRKLFVWREISDTARNMRRHLFLPYYKALFWKTIQKKMKLKHEFPFVNMSMLLLRGNNSKPTYLTRLLAFELFVRSQEICSRKEAAERKEIYAEEYEQYMTHFTEFARWIVRYTASVELAVQPCPEPTMRLCLLMEVRDAEDIARQYYNCERDVKCQETLERVTLAGDEIWTISEIKGRFMITVDEESRFTRFLASGFSSCDVRRSIVQRHERNERNILFTAIAPEMFMRQTHIILAEQFHRAHKRLTLLLVTADEQLQYDEAFLGRHDITLKEHAAWTSLMSHHIVKSTIVFPVAKRFFTQLGQRERACVLETKARYELEWLSLGWHLEREHQLSRLATLTGPEDFEFLQIERGLPSRIGDEWQGRVLPAAPHKQNGGCTALGFRAAGNHRSPECR